MRGTRWLLPLAISAILGVVALKYRAQKKTIRAQAPAKPSRYAEGLERHRRPLQFRPNRGASR